MGYSLYSYPWKTRWRSETALQQSRWTKGKKKFEEKENELKEKEEKLKLKAKEIKNTTLEAKRVVACVQTITKL